MAKLIAKTYGVALFELAAEKAQTEEFLGEFSSIRQIISVNPKFMRLMVHPQILKEAKIEVLETVFKGRVSDEMCGFLALLVTKDRFADIEAIYDYFEATVKESLGIGVVYVTTAYVLSEIHKAHINERLLEVTDYKKLEIHYSVDENLVGGIVFRIGDRVADSSIATQLNKLKKQLHSI